VDKILIFVVLKQWLLRQRETKASFVYVIFAVLLVNVMAFEMAACCHSEFSDTWDFIPGSGQGRPRTAWMDNIDVDRTLRGRVNQNDRGHG